MKSTHNFLRRFIASALIFCGLLHTPDAFAFPDFPSVTCDSASLALMERTWREFRKIHPFPFQTVALKHQGDTCVFVMSEPDRWVKRETLANLFRRYNGHLIVGRHLFGYNGALYDATGCAVLNSNSFPIFQKELFELLYGSDYKPFYTNLDTPLPHVYFSKDTLEYDLSNLNWDTWKRQEKFMDVTDKTATLNVFANASATNELYYSQERGFVAWRICLQAVTPSDTAFHHNARRFALDTDLILHAFKSGSSLFVIGRERELPVTVLPPLRVETICSLAFAGDNKMSVCFINATDSLRNDDPDIPDSLVWITPIEMTPTWRNTELGNLMILTDMILKSWSERAQVYDYFVGYPHPNSGFPYDVGVAEHLGYQPEYMWIIPENPERIGCLKPAYLPKTNKLSDNNSLTELSKTNYEYFAKLNNTDLARVAQYAHLCWAFNLMKSPDTKSGSIKSDEQGQSLWPGKITDYQDSLWVITPAYTISNMRWGYGGYGLQQGRVPKPRTIKKKASKGKKTPPSRPERNNPIKRDRKQIKQSTYQPSLFNSSESTDFHTIGISGRGNNGGRNNVVTGGGRNSSLIGRNNGKLEQQTQAELQAKREKEIKEKEMKDIREHPENHSMPELNVDFNSKNVISDKPEPPFHLSTQKSPRVKLISNSGQALISRGFDVGLHKTEPILEERGEVQINLQEKASMSLRQMVGRFLERHRVNPNEMNSMNDQVIEVVLLNIIRFLHYGGIRIYDAA